MQEDEKLKTNMDWNRGSLIENKHCTYKISPFSRGGFGKLFLFIYFLLNKICLTFFFFFQF